MAQPFDFLGFAFPLPAGGAVAPAPGTDPLAQAFASPITLSESGTFPVGGTFAADPSAWAVECAVYLSPADAPLVVSAGTPAVTGPDDAGDFAATWTAALTLAQVAALRPGPNTVRVRRTDPGSEEVLAKVVLLVLPV